ncbi:LysR family transcriptional regulator [Betaproteobacteria bacterium PRO7]|jgi:DNA-binding transcriptional LysR family regulator|nr:LysR family transcriptional regulator [Betaproteobacteria bacterium PRO7]GIL04652.1 MAG: LysR family transcriptional regulator [Betaproteobacteria bacterium]
MDHFKQIATFVSVAQRGSLSAAARHEGIAPAMVSRRLDALEARLGVKLLQRTTRRLSLTPEGAAFVEDCQRILSELEAAETAVSARGLEATGHLRITAPAGFGRKYIAPLAAEFAREHPRLNVSLDLSDRVVDLLAEGFDCAIRFGEQADSSLVRIKLGESLRVVVAAPVYLRRRGQPGHPAELAHHLCLTLGDGTGAGSPPQRGWTFTIDGAPSTIRVAAALACNDGAVLHEWALAGLGLAWRSLWEVGDDILAGRLVSVLDRYAAAPTPVYCVFPARKHLPLRVRLFIEKLKAAFADDALRLALGASTGSRRAG